MAILFAEDFKGYGNNSGLLLNGLWGDFTNVGLNDDPDPNSGGGKVAYFNGAQNRARRPFAKGALATAGLALRLWLPTLPDFEVAVMRFLNGGNGLETSLYVTATGVIELYHGVKDHGGVFLAATPAPALTANSWHHVEFKVVCDPVAGSAEVRVDGISVLEIANVNTGVALQIGLGTTDDYSGTSGVAAYYKDLVAWDGSGDENKNFLGTVSVVSMTTDSDVSLNWTPSNGATGWNLLNGSPPDDADNYITAATPPPPASTFGLTDLPLNVSSVRALITQVRARKSDGGDGSLQVGLISTGTEIDGANRPLTTAFTYYEDVFEIDPHTSDPWTPASADAAEFSINRTA